ncbi:MAG TPA: hypothetical protein VIX20_02920, partial [Ktedonobacteraceae bacterium]
MGGFLMYTAIFAFAIPSSIVVIIVIVLAAIILVAALLFLRGSEKKRRADTDASSDWQRQGQQPAAWGTPGAASPGGQQQWDVPSSPDPWAQPQQGGSPWGQPGNQPAAPTAYGSG